MNGPPPPVTGRGLFKHYDDLRDQAEAAEEAATSAIIGGVRPEELQVCSAIDLLSGIQPYISLVFVSKSSIQRLRDEATWPPQGWDSGEGLVHATY